MIEKLSRILSDRIIDSYYSPIGQVSARKWKHTKSRDEFVRVKFARTHNAFKLD